MAIKTYKPTSPGRRGMTSTDLSQITRSKPEKSLLGPLKKSGGRNNYGRTTCRFRGGGHKRRYRFIDFKRDKDGVAARVVSIEYDPNRTGRIALVEYEDGEKRYILAPQGLKVGDMIKAGDGADIKPGNALPLQKIPSGTMIHNIEMMPGGGAKMVRSAGAAAQLMVREGEYALLRLPSGEMRRVRSDCMATIGQVGNVEHGNIKLGKAGRKRHLGWRPAVRGSAMSPRDHPHGGGEGRAPIGMPSPKSPWGKPTLGYKTRRNKATDKWIVRRRGKKRR